MSLRIKLLIFFIAALFFASGLFLFSQIMLENGYLIEIRQLPPTLTPSPITVSSPTATTSASLSPSPTVIFKPRQDIPPQQPLASPPEAVKAVYATGYSAGSKAKMDYLIKLIKETELNAMVIDIKDFSGYVLYNTDLEAVKKYGALDVRISKLNILLKRLHDENIYAIARISVFQDPRLALARPDLAFQSSSTKKLWLDNKGLAWIDPAAKAAWDYNIAIAKEALDRGFDEVNFDYIRFASDGNLDDIIYPAWRKTRTDADLAQTNAETKREVIKNFFKYLRKELPDVKLSADLFGLTAVNYDDLGIGQYFEDALPYFDYLAPMVYPSHYHSGFSGYQNPAKHPYEVVKYSMDEAFKRLRNWQLVNSNLNNSTTSPITNYQLPIAKLRPWLQDFDLGANYDAVMVRSEIQAVYDAFCSPANGRDAQICNPSSNDFGDKFGGWMLWDPNNIYTKEALINE